MGLWSQIAEDWRFYRFAENPGGSATALFEPGFWLVAAYRFGHWARGIGNPALGIPARLAARWCKFWIGAMTGADLMPGAEIGKRFHVHTFHAIVVANEARIGDDCTVNSGVCVVHSANGKGGGAPVIGDCVRLGVGAKVLGKVKVGDFSIIGANAVVTRDVPPCSAAIGIPAACRPVPKEFIDEYFDPGYHLRKAGLLPERPRPDSRSQS